MNKIITEIEKRGVKFFLDHTNLDESTTGYGLTMDDTSKPTIATVAGSGFMLASLIIGDKKGYLEKDVAVDIARKTLKNFYYNIDHYEGFFIHFANFTDGSRHRKCEYSTIDTVIFLCGAIAVDSYFKDSIISEYFQKIINRIRFDKFVFNRNGKPTFYMSYNPDKDGQYVEGEPGFIHHWGIFAEQLPMYVIYAGLGFDKALDVYNSFDRVFGEYKDFGYYYTPGNALFVYQYPLCFLDLENIKDNDGINWHQNAQVAVRAHQQLSIDLMDKYKSFNKFAYGFTAGKTKGGYRVHRGLPNTKNKYDTDGTVHPNAVVGSLTLDNEIALAGINYLYNIPNLFGKYGFVEGFNKDLDWISSGYLSIDKGLELLMANAYLSNDVRKAFMSHNIIKKGMKILKWK